MSLGLRESPQGEGEMGIPLRTVDRHRESKWIAVATLSEGEDLIDVETTE